MFSTVAAILGFALSSVRTRTNYLARMSWPPLYLNCRYVLLSTGYPEIRTYLTLLVMIVTIAVGIQDRPAAAPQTDTPWVSDYKLIGHPSFTEGITAVCSLGFAFSGVPGFFAIVSEMRDPQKYTPALLVCQAGVTAIYMVIGCVVYYYCGIYVSSLALGSAGGDVKKIAYGFALPGLIVTTTICSHVSPQQDCL